MRIEKNLTERQRNAEKNKLLTCLKEEIDPSVTRRRLTEEETILETINLIDRLEKKVCRSANKK